MIEKGLRPGLTSLDTVRNDANGVTETHQDDIQSLVPKPFERSSKAPSDHQPLLLTPEVEKKMRKRWSKTTTLADSSVERTNDGKWAIIDECGDVVAIFERRDDAVFHARSIEYVDALLQEVAQLRRLLHS